ncbi:MAG: hypothetical protein QXF07_00595 [Candidatus Micrarchaeia archaeon]
MSDEKIHKIKQMNEHDIHKRAGKLTVFTGPMRSKKTALLIEEIWQSEYMGLKTKAFLHRLSRSDQIQSRMSLKTYNAIKIENAFEIFKYIELDTQVIAIDEAQFFGNEILTTVKILINGGKDIFVSGLDLNWKGEPFGPMGGLMAMADEVIKSKTVCSIPGCQLARYATKTGFNSFDLNGSQLDATNAPDIFVGDENIESKVYPTRCNLHWHYILSNEEKETIDGLSEEIKSMIKMIDKKISKFYE